MVENKKVAETNKLNNLMIRTIRKYGVSDEKVISAIRNVLRHRFIPSGLGIDEIYSDSALPIGSGQTISQPFTVAFMCELLDLKEGLNVLEIGTGSGWNAALIKDIVGKSGKVTTVEFNKDIFSMAKQNLKSFEIELVFADGSLGYRKNAPFDRIIATCASPDILETWKEQLSPGGIIVAPVGKHVQLMVKFRKLDGNKIGSGTNSESSYSAHGLFSFVPLLGKKGFSE
jgi:protein-L-isoaspartate(D-aspartate) O-methyltransferase